MEALSWVCDFSWLFVLNMIEVSVLAIDSESCFLVDFGMDFKRVFVWTSQAEKLGERRGNPVPTMYQALRSVYSDVFGLFFWGTSILRQDGFSW